MQDVLTLPTEKDNMRESVVTSRTHKPKKRSIQQLPESVIHTNGDSTTGHSSNGGSPNGAMPHVKNEPKPKYQDDPYPHGWRYIETTTEEGEIEFSRVALTHYDLLHPQEGYVIVQRTPHDQNITYVNTAVGTYVDDDPKAFVFGELRVDLNLPKIKPVSPDISVFLDVAEKKDWSTFNCEAEGVFPSAVFEITSPSTRENDFGKKHEYYRRAGIPFYVILDIEYDKDDQVVDYHLHVFQLTGGEYVATLPNAQGRYWLPPLEVWVGLGDEGILCYDSQGNLLMSHTELSQALDEAIKRADEQEQMVQEAEDHAAEQERLAQEAEDRAVEQERLAQEAEDRAVEQERLAQEAEDHAAEQGRLAQEAEDRAAEQERMAKEEAERATKAEEENARLRAIIEQVGGIV